MSKSKKSTTSRVYPSGEISTDSAPDGGWGWVIVVCAMVLNFLIGGAVNTFGVLYVSLLDMFKQSAGATAWVGSMANAMGLLLGPLSSALSMRFSCRTMVIVGGLLVSAGWISTGFMPRLEYMYITYGLLAGIGKSMSYTPSIVIVGQWFDKRRSLANGLAVAGAGFGTFAFAPLLETLLRDYGFKYTMFIMGSAMLLICVCGFLLRPVPGINQRNKRFTIAERGSKTGEAEHGCGQTVCVLDVKDITSVTNGNCIIPEQEKTKTVKDYLDYTLLKNANFMCFAISVMLATLGHSPASVMLPALAKHHNVAPQKAAFLLSITGITDIIGRLAFGIICDIHFLKSNRIYLYAASIFISGLANLACGFATTYWQFASYAAVFGLFAGSYNALTPVILVDLLGVKKLPSSFGLALLFQGMGFLLGPPVAGWMKDGFGNYRATFYFAGVSMILSSLVINISPLLQRHKTQQISPSRDGSSPARKQPPARKHSPSIENSLSVENSWCKGLDNPMLNIDEEKTISVIKQDGICLNCKPTAVHVDTNLNSNLNSMNQSETKDFISIHL